MERIDCEQVKEIDMNVSNRYGKAASLSSYRVPETRTRVYKH